jgi:hypothetical protein
MEEFVSGVHVELTIYFSPDLVSWSELVLRSIGLRLRLRHDWLLCDSTSVAVGDQRSRQQLGEQSGAKAPRADRRKGGLGPARGREKRRRVGGAACRWDATASRGREERRPRPCALTVAAARRADRMRWWMGEMKRVRDGVFFKSSGAASRPWVSQKGQLDRVGPNWMCWTKKWSEILFFY